MALSLLIRCKVWYLSHPDELAKLDIEELPCIITNMFNHIEYTEMFRDTEVYFTVPLKNGRKQGKAIGSSSFYTIECYYDNGLLHGSYKVNSQSELVIDGNYTNGEPTGLWCEIDHGDCTKKFYDNGRLMYIEISDIAEHHMKQKVEYLENGYVQTWYSRGDLYKVIPYNNKHKYNGLVLEYSLITGILIKEEPYIDGIMHGLERSWYNSGQPKSTQTYINGKRHGENIEYYPNGVVHEIHNYEMGELTGLCQLFSEIHGLKYKCTYKKGIHVGYARGFDRGVLSSEIYHDEDGNEVIDKKYSNGRLYSLIIRLFGCKCIVYYDGNCKKILERYSTNLHNHYVEVLKKNVLLYKFEEEDNVAIEQYWDMSGELLKYTVITDGFSANIISKPVPEDIKKYIKDYKNYLT